MDLKVDYYYRLPLPEISKQTLKTMKLIAVILFAACLQASARGYSQITLSENNAPLQKVFQKIQQQSGYDFVSTYETLKEAGNVTVNVRNVSLQEALEECLKGKPLTYVIIGKTVVVQSKEKDYYNAVNNSIALVPVPPPPVVIHGRVLNQQGQPLQNVSVLIAGTKIGAATDSNGQFIINAPDDKNIILEISSVGYQAKKVNVGKQTEVNVTLELDVAGLNDVVVVGYGTQRKSSVTAAISTLKTDEIVNAPTANISNALNGRISGVIAAQSSGKPGSDGAEIHIRGIATSGNSSPLIIVDGVPRDFTRIDPNTIESFTVLKDAAAVAPYGMAGANGVILITTKSGKAGSPTMSYNAYLGYQNPTTLMEMVNSYEYAKLKNIADVNGGQSPTFSDAAIEGFRKSVTGALDADYDKYPNTDPYGAMLDKNTPLTSHNLSISGGSDKVLYYIGLGYLYQQGLWETIKNKRYNGIINIETKPTKTTSVKLSLNAFNDVINNPSSGMDLSLVSFWSPTNPLQFTNGYLANNNGSRSVLPLKTLGSRVADETSIRGQLSIQQDIPFIKGLNIKGVLSYDPSTVFSKNWNEAFPVTYNINTTTSPYTFTPVVDAGKPSLAQSSFQSKAYTYQGFLNYHTAVGNSDITALAGFEARNTTSNNFFVSRSNYDLNIDEITFGNSDPKYWGTGGTSTKTSQVGYLYRLSYAYAGKYLLETSGRYDGHYYFAPGKKYGFFPAFSLGWRLSEESFIKGKLAWIDNLKIRGSWGKSGNLAGGPFQYSNSMSISSNSYIFNNVVYQGASERLEANPNITWEVATKTNIGIDATLFKRLLNFQIDYFYERRNNMLVSPGSLVPAEYGIGIAQVNAGIMENRGVDMSLGSTHKFSNGLILGINGNFTFARNKLIQTFENPTTLNDPNRSRTGRPLNGIFGLRALGLFQVSDDKNNDGKITTADGFPLQTYGTIAPGDIRYEDLNGDGKINSSDEVYLDKGVLPEIIYGFSPRVSFKRFDFTVLFQGSARSSVILRKHLVLPFFSSGEITKPIADDYWTPENTNARFPRLLIAGGTNNQQQSSFWLWDAAYLRVKNIELAYNLPTGVLSKLKLQSFRLYASGQNVFTMSKVKAFIDPEMNQRGTQDANTNGWYYPQQRVVSLGFNITF